MSKKKMKAGDIKRRLASDEENLSPFASIKLVPKKEEEKKTERKPAVKSTPKKPSEIVQGYNPSSSFADILYAYEHTGNPYAMPSKANTKKIAESKTDFGRLISLKRRKALTNLQNPLRISYPLSRESLLRRLRK